MVQFNSNLNIPKTVGLTSSAKVGQAGEDENKQAPKAGKSAVWIVNSNIGPEVNKGFEPKLGDVIITIERDKVYYHRKTIDAQGEYVWMDITADDIQDSDYETDRGDIRR